MSYILSQIFGACGALIIVLSFQFKDVKKLLVMQIVSSFMFGMQFLFLGAYSGLVCNAAGMLLRLAVYLRDKNGGRLPGEKKGKAIIFSPCMWAFFALFAIIGVFTYSGPVSLLPSAAMIVFTYAIWNADPRFIRKMNFFFCCPMWLIYSISQLAVAGIITETFNIISIAVSWLRFYRKTER